MRPRLGLVCITDCDLVRFRRVTLTRLRQLEAKDPGAAERALREVYEANLVRLARAIQFCVKHEIKLYRVTSHLFPFSDDPLGHDLLDDYRERIAEIGGEIDRAGIRFIIHPDQFVVLSSDTPRVIENSIKILENHARIFDLLGRPRSPWSAIILHGGKGGRADRLVDVTRNLSEGIRTRLCFENDERAYGADEILDVCRRTGCPMIFDAHHHVVHQRLDDFEHPSVAHYFHAARDTWPDPAWQIVHISNGKTDVSDPRHSDTIDVMPSVYREAPWIEVEAKRKEVAIQKLREEWIPSLA